MATNLTGLKVKDTYNSLLKIGDNSSLSATPDKISDGLGNESILYLSTSQVSIGTIPATGYDLTVNSATKTGSLDVVGAATAASLRLTGGSGSQGTLSWNTDEETVDIIQNGAVLQLGQEIHVHVKNQTGSTINDGTPVYVTGTLGSSGRLTVAPMIADGSIEAKYFLGVTTEDIPNGEDGKVTTFGKIRGLDTTAYTEGQTLYVSASTAGFWQTTAPVAPSLDLEAAIVINVSANNGTIFVRAQQGHYLGMLHDVYISSPANNQFLVYNSTTSRWENQGIASVGSINLQSVTDNGSTTTNNITVGDGSADNRLKVYYSDVNSSTEITGFGIIFNRGSSYLRPFNDGTQTLYVGGSDPSLDWSMIQFKYNAAIIFNKNGTETFRVDSNTRIMSGNLQMGSDVVIDSDRNITANDIEAVNATFTGDLTVSGTTTFIDTTNLNIGDAVITLNADITGTTAPTEDAGIEVKRGSSSNVSFLWDEANDRWTLGTEHLVASNFIGSLTGAASLNVLKAGDTMTGNLKFNDSVKAQFGSDNDFVVQHNGTHAYLDNNTGSIFLRTYTDDADIVLSSDDGSGSLTQYLRVDGSEGSVNLYHYGSKKLETTSTGVSVTGALSGNISTSSISGGTIDINGTTAINLQYNGTTQLRIDTFGVAYLGTVTFANDGISLTDEDSTIDSFFHANVAYDAGLYQILSNARYGADYIQVDGNDTRGNTVFAISPKDSTTTNPDLFLGGNNSVTSPNTLTDWRNIKMNATSVKINGNEVATRTWVTSNFTLDLDDVTTNGATTTNSITVGGLDTGGTVKTKSLLIDSGGSDSDIGEKFVYRISNTSSAGTTWRKVCEVSLPTGTYVALSMDIKFCYPSSNYGSSAQQKIWYYTASFRRSSGTQDDLNDALLYGYSINYVRIVKTATGEYELQARGNSNNVGFIVEYTVTAGNPNNITPTDGSVNGNTTGTIYIASTNDGNGIYGAGFIAARKFVKEGGSSSEFLKADGSVDSNTYLTSYTETDTLATVTGRGASTTSPITITSDSNLLNLRSSTNGNGAKINFSDQSSASYVQNGTLRYVHVDTASYGSGNAFIFESTEPSLTVLADGKLMYAEGIYSKPASGTGAGTRKDANWDSAYTFTSTFDITDYTDAKYLRSDANDETTGYLRVTGTYTNTSGVILGTFDGSTASSNAFTAAGIILGGGGKTGWGDGDVHGAIRWYNTDGSGIGARDAAKILAINTVGNGTSTTTFNGELAFYTSAYNATATEKVRIDDAGNLGVNTETPLHKLQIVGDGQFGESATVSEDSRVRIRTSSDGFIGMVRTGIRTWAHKIDAGGHYYIRNVDASYNTLTLTDTNRVGIGNTEPSGMLHVADQASTVTLMLGRASGTATIKSDGTADGHMIIDSGTNGTAVWLQNYTSGNVYLATGGGSVGIGTTSLSYKLDVAGTARIQSNAQINGDLTVLGSTNGVYVNSSGHASVRIDRGSTSYDNNLLFYTAGALDFRIWQDGSSDYLYVRDETGGGGNMVTFRKGGNVGIGVVPTEKLHVEGKITTSGRNYSYGQENFHIRMTEDSAVYGYMGNVNGSIYFANGSYYGSQIYNVTSGQTGLTTVYLGEGTFEIRNATFASGSSTASTSRRVLMDTLGNIGLNRDSCEAKLDVNGAILARGGSYSASIDSVSNASLVVEKGDIIYMTDGTYIRHLIQYNTSSTIVIGQTGTALIADVEIRTGSSGNFKVFTNGGETMRMDSAAKLHVENDIIAFSSTVSDARLKDEVQTIDNALDKVKALRGVEYVWNKGGREGQKDLGFIAQEVEQVIPEIVRENEMPLLDDSGEKYKTVDYEKMVAVLIEAIKEQQKQIDELKARLDGSTK